MQSIYKFILIFYTLIGTTHAQEYFTTTYGGSYLEQLTKMRPTTRPRARHRRRGDGHPG